MINPPPIQVPIVAQGGGISAPWIAWFDQLRGIVYDLEDPASSRQPDTASAVAALAAALFTAIQELKAAPVADVSSVTKLVDTEIQELAVLPRTYDMSAEVYAGLDDLRKSAPIVPARVEDVENVATRVQGAELGVLGAPVEAVEALTTRVQALENAVQLADQSLQAAVAQHAHELSLLVQAPPPREFISSRYAQFYDTSTQTVAAINTATPITYNTTAISNGVYLGVTTSQIFVDSPGVYNFQFSVQLDKTSGGTALFYIWLRINGVDVADSASQVQIQGNDSEIFTAANFFLELKADDYVEFMWAAGDTSVQLQYFAATAFSPAIPSVIVTVTNSVRALQ